MDKKTLDSLKMLFFGDMLIREGYARNNLEQPPYQDSNESTKILKILEKTLDKESKK